MDSTEKTTGEEKKDGTFPLPELGTFPGLDAETERQIKLDFINTVIPEYFRSEYTIDQVYIVRYYGNYQGCVPVVMDAQGMTYAAVNTLITVANMDFGFGSANVARVWYQSGEPGSGLFYWLAEAYDLGLLTEADIKNLHKRHHEPFPSMEEVYGGNHENYLY